MSTPDATGETSAKAAATVATATPGTAPASVGTTTIHAAAPASPRRPWLWGLGAIVLLGLVVIGVPSVQTLLDTVSTDDAYVNGHVTFVAPRVSGQVARVFVENNNRVRKGDLLVELDKEPFEVAVGIAKAMVGAADADLVAARAQVRGAEGKARSLRFNLQRMIEDVDNQTALLRSRVATLKSQKASLDRAEADFHRAEPLVQTGAISKEEFDQRRESLSVAEARVEEALEGVHQVRVGLGLPPEPESGDDLTQVPEDLDQTFSAVKVAQAQLIEAAAALGVVQPFNVSPKEMVATFYKRDPQGDIDKIYEELLKEAPAVKQAEAKLAEAQQNLDQAELNLRYCDVVAEIDGVVTRREVNPGNNVVVGQSLMAIRSLTDIWIDANFKETQLRNLRIGQSVDLDVDMYGGGAEFKGRISGFTMGTGSTLALLPAENATGNFVKVVQRLPVRIEVLDYDPEKVPLFIGLSVTPYVHIKDAATGPDAGKFLQPYLPEAAAAAAVDGSATGSGGTTEKNP